MERNSEAIMPVSTAHKYLGCLIFLSIWGLIESANVSKAERSLLDSTTKFLFSKNSVSTQESDIRYTEFTTELPNTDAMESREPPSTTVASELDSGLQLGRDYWIILIACFGVLFLVLAIMCMTGCLIKCFRDHSGSSCPTKNCCHCQPPKFQEYSLSELKRGSLQGNISITNIESEANRNSDSFPTEIPEPIVGATDFPNV